MTFFRSLSYRPFALLWSGQTVSRLGDAVYRLALGWWVLQKTGSAAITSTVYIVGFAPMLVFLLIGGVFADRLPRLRVMFWADIARGLITLVLAYLAATDVLEVWHVLVASGLFGFAEAFFEPAFVSTIPAITPTPLLPSANSLESLSRQLSAILGPTLGAVMVATSGTASAFAMNAATFFVGAACLIPILFGEVTPARAIGMTFATTLRDFLEGVRTVLSTKWVWVTIAIAALGNICIGAVRGVGTPLLVQHEFHADVAALGLLNTAAAGGGVIAAMIIGSVKRLRHRGIFFYATYALAGIGLVSVGLQHSPLAALPGMMLMGAASPVLGLIWTNTLQEMIPHDKLGRVNSVDLLGSFALLPMGYGLVGWYGDHAGAATLFMTAGGVAVVLGLVGLCVRDIRALD
jgi:DHA3 family tetracycline resistance protein-like MFS transporter